MIKWTAFYKQKHIYIQCKKQNTMQDGDDFS